MPWKSLIKVNSIVDGKYGEAITHTNLSCFNMKNKKGGTCMSK